MKKAFIAGLVANISLLFFAGFVVTTLIALLLKNPNLAIITGASSGTALAVSGISGVIMAKEAKKQGEQWFEALTEQTDEEEV
jgi:hypothetical protein